jgi:hypothetical protein
MDIFLPHAESCLLMGMIPIFSPLEPGGDYWDTAFLHSAIESLKRRAYPGLVRQIVIGAVARSANRPLNWGAGGPERWPGARPYYTPAHEEDQIGFRIFDWYNAYIQAVLCESRPVFLFEVGPSGPKRVSPETHTQVNLDIARLMTGKPVGKVEPIPENVIGSAFWLLVAGDEDQSYPQAWFHSPQEPRPIMGALENDGKDQAEMVEEPLDSAFAIRHYLLLPTYEGEISDVHFDQIRPFVKKHHPTIGFSIQEARQAQRVTILNSTGTYPHREISQLRSAGCIVHEIDANGIDIASI